MGTLLRSKKGWHVGPFKSQNRRRAHLFGDLGDVPTLVRRRHTLRRAHLFTFSGDGNALSESSGKGGHVTGIQKGGDVAEMHKGWYVKPWGECTFRYHFCDLGSTHTTIPVSCFTLSITSDWSHI